MKGFHVATMLGLGGLLGFIMGVAAFFLLPSGQPRTQASPMLAAVMPLPPQPGVAESPPAPVSRLQAPPAPRPPAPPDTARPALRRVRRRSPVRARLAIVIDDIGHNLRAPRRFLALKLPLTFSVLPELRYSRAAAEMLRREGREFLVHLPMQPLRYPAVDPGPSPLLLRLDERATLRRTERYFEGLPGAIGASNHMGSAYTLDAARMGAVQRVVARRGLLFLNSKTSASPVPRRIARERGYPYLERNVFLDNVRSEAAVRRQLRRAVRAARRLGRAVAVGHPYPETLRVLRDDLLPLLGADVALVPLSLVAGR